MPVLLGKGVLGKGVSLRLGRSRSELSGAYASCFRACARGHWGSVEDPVKILVHDVLDLLNIDQSLHNSAQTCHKDSDCEQVHKLSTDVQKQLHRVLDTIKELTMEKGEGAARQKHVADEAVELLEEFVAMDLPAQLLAELPLLEFEARKDVMNICCALLWSGMPQQIEQQVLQYLTHHPRVFSVLVAGYKNEEAALHYGVVLRSFARHAELVEAFLHSGLLFDLLRHTRHPSIDISSDALYSLSEMLLEHKEVSGPWMDNNFKEFFSLYNGLLESKDYFLERQALPLLASMLLDRHFKMAMFGYVKDHRNLQIHMNLLLNASKVVQNDAFQVFKLFVADPKKSPRVHLILYKNKGRLVELLETMEARRVEEEERRPAAACSADSGSSGRKAAESEQRTIIERLQGLAPPPPRDNTAVPGYQAI